MFESHLLEFYSSGFHLPELRLESYQAIVHASTGLNLLKIQPIVLVNSGSVWTQLLTALVVGLLTAFAFQFLLTNLGIAIGISVWGMRSTSSDRSTDQSPHDSPDDLTDELSLEAGSGSNKASSNLSTTAGLGILLTVNLVLFAACFLAAKFSQVNSPTSGAIAGVVVWAAYLLLLLWISSTAVTSVVGSILGATTGGFRRIVSTIGSALSGSDDEAVTQAQMIATIREETQAALDAVNLRQMLEAQMQTVPTTETPQLQPQSALSESNGHRPESLWQPLQAYLLDSRSSSLTPKRVDRKLQKLLQEAEIATGQNNTLEFDRTAIIQWLDQRQDLSDKKKNRIIDQIEETWKHHWQEQYQEQFLESNQSNPQPAQTNQSEQSQDLSQLAMLLLKSASGATLKQATLKQALSNLPELLQRLQTTLPDWTEVAPIVLPVVLNKLRDALDATDSSTPEHSTLQQNLEHLLDYSQLGWLGLNQAVTEPLERWHDRSMQQIESIQHSAQQRIEQVKQQTQQRIETTRKAAATAAWWLFLTASTAACSAALAGALASGQLL